MKVDVELYPAVGRRQRSTRSMGIAAPQPYRFAADVIALRRVMWRGQFLGGVQALAFIPTHLRRFVNREDSKRVSDALCWLSVDAADKSTVVPDFLASGALDWTFDVKEVA